MLISLYASYRLARRKQYTAKIATLVIFVSFFSAYFGVCIGAFLLGPLPVLSFPFYAIQDEMHGAPLPPDGYSLWIHTYRVHFLAAELSNLKANDSASLGTYRLYGYHILFLNQEIGYITTPYSSSYPLSYTLSFPFAFFLLVNTAGAIIGYAMSKQKTLEKSKWKLKASFGKIALGVLITTTGILISNIGVATTVRNPPWTGQYVTITLYPYQKDAGAFFIFGITWLVMVILDFAWTQKWPGKLGEKARTKLVFGSMIAIPLGFVLFLIIGPWYAHIQMGVTLTYWIGNVISFAGLIILISGVFATILAVAPE
jgi:hypothetical protein